MQHFHLILLSALLPLSCGICVPLETTISSSSPPSREEPSSSPDQGDGGSGDGGGGDGGGGDGGGGDERALFSCAKVHAFNSAPSDKPLFQADFPIHFDTSHFPPPVSFHPHFPRNVFFFFFTLHPKPKPKS